MAVSEHTTTLPVSRRRLLAGAGATAAIAAVAAPAYATQADLVVRMAEILADAKARQHPDAELFAAWREYVEVVGIYDSMPTTMTDAEIAPWTERLDRCRDRMETIPAQTMEGVNVKLRYLLTSMTEHPSADAVLVHGQPATEAFEKRVNSDFREAMVWRMIQASSVVGGVA